MNVRFERRGGFDLSRIIIFTRCLLFKTGECLVKKIVKEKKTNVPRPIRSTWPGRIVGPTDDILDGDFRTDENASGRIVTD